MTAFFDVAGLPAQFRQVWQCHDVQTLVYHNAESECDTFGEQPPVEEQDFILGGLCVQSV